MTSDTGNKVLGEQQADVPRSRGGTDRRCKNNARVELIPDPKLGGFTARILDIPAYGEGETEDEAIVDLKEALRAYIEAFGIDDALARANVALTVRPLDWTLQDLTPPPWLDCLAQAADKWSASWNRKALQWFGCAGASMA